MKIFSLFIILTFSSLNFAMALEKGKDSNAIVRQIIEVEQKRVIERADKMLEIKPRTVTANTCPRSIGGKHDFFSEGPYWWPDPANPKGPYIRHDGLRNPDRFENHDNDLRDFSWIVGTQTSAYILTGKTKYLNAAMDHIKAWFVDTTTRMNPNMLYAQAIQGVCTGRGIGIIDAVPLMDVAQSVMILEQSPAVSGKDITQIKEWFVQFLAWLTTHPYGVDEMNAKNNHGTWWHAQVAVYAKLVGDKKALQLCLNHYKEIILPEQMAADGSFPLEIERTKPYSYSLFNLDATTSLAWILSDKSFDVWNFSLSDGRGIEKGLNFMHPYLKDKTQWPYNKDVSHWEEQPDARQFMLFAALAGNNQEWFSIWKSLGEKNSSDESRLALALKNPLLWMRLPETAPKIILKLDDLSASKGICPSAPTFDYLMQKQLKAGFGAIADRFDSTGLSTLNSYLKATNAKGEKLFEVWHHGLDHVNPEFKGTNYDYQKAHFDQADKMIKKGLDVQMHSFGSPYNASDSVTNIVISENPNYKVFMFSSLTPGENHGILYLNHRVSMENGTGNPEFSVFMENYAKLKGKYKDYMILQGHPNMWTPEKLEQFKKIIDFLISEGCEFVLPFEYYNSISM